MNILSSEEYQDIVSWMPDGKAFMVKKPKAFVANILPVHFKEVKFSSFTRKVCLSSLCNRSLIPSMILYKHFGICFYTFFS